MKLFGAMLVLGVCIHCGMTAAAKLTRRAGRIRLLRQLLTDAESALQFTLLPVGDLLHQLAGQAVYRELTFLQDAAAHAESFPESWHTALQADSRLMPDEKAVLETFGSTLGSTALDGQISTIGLCLERLAQMQTDAEQYAKEKGGLYRSLGLFGGLFCVILLL